MIAFVRTGANLPVLLFFGLTVISCLLSRQKEYSVQETLRIGAGVLLYFVVTYQFRRTENLSRLLDTLIFAGITASMVGFIRYSASTDQRAMAIFGNDQLLGSFLMILLPILAATALSEKAGKRQLAAQVATVLTAACLLLAHSRSAWLGCAGGLLVYGALALCVGKKKNLTQRKHELVLPIMLVAVSVGFFLMIWPDADSIVQRLTTFSMMSKDVTLNQRAVYYTGAQKMIHERPLTGFGIGTYPYYQYLYTNTGLPLPQLKGMRSSLGEQAHNLYLQTAAEMGIPGLLLLLAIPVTFLVAGTRRVLAMDRSIRSSLLIASMASTVAVGIDGMGSPSWHFGQTTMFFWLILGLGTGCMRPAIKSSRRSRHSKEEPELEQPKLTRATIVMGALALAALLPTVVYAGGGDSYVVPKSADITPKNASIFSPGSEQYSLEVTFSNGTRSNVTLLKGTNFIQTGGLGQMEGKNHSIYQSRRGENDKATVTGTYTQGGKSVSASTLLTINQPVPVRAVIAPKNATIFSPDSQAFTLLVTYSDGSIVDVTEKSGTAFRSFFGLGHMTGTNQHIYQSVRFESDNPTIGGGHTEAGRTVTAVTTLHVRRPR